MSAVESLLAKRHLRHLEEIQELEEVEGFLNLNADDARRAEAFLNAYRDKAAYREVLSRAVRRSQAELQEEQGYTGWRPPAETPLGIGDHIGHDALSTAASPLARPNFAELGEIVDGVYTCANCRRPVHQVEDSQWTHSDTNHGQCEPPPGQTLVGADVCSCNRPLMIDDHGQFVHINDHSPTCRTAKAATL